MQLRQGVGGALWTLVFGVGAGHASLGRWPRAFAWLGLLFASGVATAFSVWFVVLVPLAYFGSAIDAFFVGARTEGIRLRPFPQVFGPVD